MDSIDLLKQDVAVSPRGRIAQIAEESGVALKVLRNIVYGETENPRRDNVRKLNAYYASRIQQAA